MKEENKKIPEDLRENWQDIVDSIAKILNLPAGLIMKLNNEKIEVFVSSQTENNPYHPGDSEVFSNSGLYCEHVIKTNDKLLIPNALKDEKWKTNPDIKLNMISYFGLPILYPDQSPFGTICVLDNKENAYSSVAEKLLLQLKKLIEANIAVVYMNNELGDENKNLKDFIKEIKTLRGILPICCSCKKIRDDEGYWNDVENYISERTDADFSHGICPECTEKLYGNKDWFKQNNK